MIYTPVKRERRHFLVPPIFGGSRGADLRVEICGRGRCISYVTGVDAGFASDGLGASLDDLEIFRPGEQVLAGGEHHHGLVPRVEHHGVEVGFGFAAHVAFFQRFRHFEKLRDAAEPCDVGRGELDVDAVAELGCQREGVGSSRDGAQVDAGCLGVRKLGC